MSGSARTRRIVEGLFAAVALAAYVFMAASAAAHKSNVFDELAHLTAGDAYWTLDDYRLQPENGNWPQRLGALPAVVGGATFAATDTPAWQGSDVWTVGDQFFFGRGNDIDRFLFEGRVLMAGLGACLGAIVFIWTRRLVGSTGAVVALLLFVASPTMLAHGALVTSDMAAALGFLAATAALWRVLHRVTVWTVLLSAVATAGLLLAKFSGLLIAPIACVLISLRLFLGRPLVWRAWRGRWTIERRPSRQFAIIAALGVVHVVVAAALIWASYGFRYSAFAEPSAGQHFLVDWPEVLAAGPQGESLTVRVVEWARTAKILPEAYLYGLSHTLTMAQARRSFMNGVVSNTGRADFFPYAFLVKSTLPFLALCAMGLAAWIRAPRLARRRYHLVPVAVLLVVYGGAALTSNLNIGHRHLLPLYPALMIVGGAAVAWAHPRRGSWTQPQRVVAGLVVALLAWHTGESVSVRPNYLAYFNQLAGGPSEGYRHLVDSSLDWGQDLPALKVWLDGHRLGSDEPVYLSYFGSARPSHFGIEATLLPGLLDRRPPERGQRWGAGLYVLSATMLAGVYAPTAGRWDASEEAQYRQVQLTLTTLLNQPDEREVAARQMGKDPLPGVLDALDNFRMGRLTAFLRRRQPLAEVGYSILIYRLTDADLTQALEGPLSP